MPILHVIQIIGGENYESFHEIVEESYGALFEEMYNYWGELIWVYGWTIYYRGYFSYKMYDEIMKS